MSRYVDPIYLRQVLTERYNLSELHTLCFDLGIDYEEIGGGGKTEKVVELVAFAQRHNRLDDIAAYVRHTRPFVQLKMTDTLPPLPAAGIGSGTSITIHVAGDYVGGDKVEGDKVTGDTFNMSGDFRGAILNIKSTLTNVTQTIGALPNADEAAKANLQQLVNQLDEELKQVPADKAEEAEAVAQMTKTLVETANSEKPNKMMLQITGEGLKKAAENLAAIVPNVVKIAGAIVAGILGLG